MAAESKSSILSRAANVAAHYMNSWACKLLEYAESYSPTTSSDWDTPPTTQDAALDELAARVKALEP